MEKTDKEQLPEVFLYRIGPQEADQAAPLLTQYAQEVIKEGTAFGMALVEEDEARAALCARLSPENEAVLELLSLYVAPQFRRRGLGGTLLLEMIDAVNTDTDAGVQWVTAEFTDGVEGIEPLLQKAGFQMETDEEALLWRLPVGSLTDSALMGYQVSTGEECSLCTLAELSDYQLRKLVKELKNNEIDEMSAEQMRQADQTASYVLFDKNQKPIVCAILTSQNEKQVCLSQFFMAGGRNTAAIAVLQACAGTLVETYPEDALLEIPTVADSSAGLVQKLLPDSQPVRLTRAVLNLRNW